MNGPNPNDIHPMKKFTQICYIKNVLKSKNIIAGDYSYFDDFENSQDFEKNVSYHYPFSQDKLIIGKFCSIAMEVKFIMNGANHKISSFSSYPFYIFSNGWEKVTPKEEEFPYKGDTIIGNDVWIGYDSLIMPGVKIGNGSIIASRSVITKDIPPYTIVGGNPAKFIKKRFNDDTILLLEEIQWWDWPIEKITENLEIICSNNLSDLKKIK